MPFEKGNQWAKGCGRKSWEYEQEQLNAMDGVINSYFELLDKVANNEATKKDFIKLEAIKPAALKSMDKKHANQVKLQGDKNNPLEFSVLTEDQVNAIFNRRTKKNSASGQV